MEKQAAVAKIFAEVYTPTFVEKCASLGINFQDQEELDSALSATALFKQAAAEQLATNPQPEQVSVIKQAAIDLAKALTVDPVATISDELSDAFQSVGGN